MSRKAKADEVVINPEVGAAEPESTRGRKPVVQAELSTREYVGATPPAMAASETVMNAEMTAHEVTVRAVAAQMRYQLPGGCIDPDLIQRDIAINMRRSVEACLEVGRGLRVLKESCEHGEFLSRLDVLGIEGRVAQKFMQSAVKFSKVSSTALLKATGSQTKLFEMLVLDDEDLEELELTGQTGELKLDDVATMSVKELRAALRKAKESDAAKDRILQEKNAKLDALAMKKPHEIPWPEEVVKLKDELHGLGKVADEAISKHLTLIEATEVLLSKLDPDVPLEKARIDGHKSTVHRIGEQVERLCHIVASLRNEYELRLASYIAEDRTHILPAD